jgi:hypothetical protein
MNGGNFLCVFVIQVKGSCDDDEWWMMSYMVLVFVPFLNFKVETLCLACRFLLTIHNGLAEFYW